MKLSVKEVSKKYNVSTGTVYSWFKRKNLPSIQINREHLIKDSDIKKFVFTKIIKYCVLCGNSFKQKKEGQKYCCKKCREKDWILNNPERDRELKKKSRLKLHKIICKLCKKSIPDDQRRNGVQYCDGCTPLRNKAKAEKERNSAKEIRKKFKEYKESIGCAKCGYKIYGGSLDFHHTESDEKERRIDAKLWHSNSKLYQNEIKKCTLLCKNCHYEVHNKEKN
jgi:excisionase family DNA binding protein